MTNFSSVVLDCFVYMQGKVNCLIVEKMGIMKLTAIGLFQVTALKMSSIATRVESVFHLPTNVTIS
jgi:hypothetical protein